LTATRGELVKVVAHCFPESVEAGVEVVDPVPFSLGLVEENRSSANERLSILFVEWDERKEVLPCARFPTGITEW
jgi:hypothetical protein